MSQYSASPILGHLEGLYSMFDMRCLGYSLIRINQRLMRVCLRHPYRKDFYGCIKEELSPGM